MKLDTLIAVTVFTRYIGKSWKLNALSFLWNVFLTTIFIFCEIIFFTRYYNYWTCWTWLSSFGIPGKSFFESQFSFELEDIGFFVIVWDFLARLLIILNWCILLKSQLSMVVTDIVMASHLRSPINSKIWIILVNQILSRERFPAWWTIRSQFFFCLCFDPWVTASEMKVMTTLR